MSPAEVLKACALFNGFTETGLQIVAAIATPRTFSKGVPIFVENMVGDSMFIVSEGRLGLTTKNAAGTDVSLGEVGTPEALGELCLVAPSQRLCTATTLSPVSALEIRHADFQRLLAQKPQACIKLLMGVVSHFGRKVQESREVFRALLPKGQ